MGARLHSVHQEAVVFPSTRTCHGSSKRCVSTTQGQQGRARCSGGAGGCMASSGFFRAF
jgi:hypothetical protein